MTTLEALAPEDAPYTHAEEGPDDMPSHIKAMLTEVSLGIPVMGGRMVLGTWQGVYLIEHRAAPHERNIALSFIGSSQSSPRRAEGPSRRVTRPLSRLVPRDAALAAPQHEGLSRLTTRSGWWR